MKKTIKIKYVGFWENFDPNQFFLSKMLKEKYDVVECEDPDYIICSVFGKLYSYCNNPQVRIMYSGENYCPDFNLIDYGIGLDQISFGDRYFRHTPVFSKELAEKSRDYGTEILQKKTLFANFIHSHESEHAIRGDFFKKLCEYKQVSSAGTYLNNMPNGETVAYLSEEKREFQSKCKFTLCFESTSHLDFCTEKLADAFLADTIPIYYGDPNVCQIFNSKAFINVADYDSFESAIERISELDNDDEKYLSMLREPIYAEKDLVSKHDEAFKNWLYAIFDQPLEKAYRRSRVYAPAIYERGILKNEFESYTGLLYQIWQEEKGLSDHVQTPCSRKTKLKKRVPWLGKFYRKVKKKKTNKE